MTVFILIFVIIVLLGLGFAGSLKFIFRRFQAHSDQAIPAGSPEDRVRFSLSYIAAPMALMVFFIIISAVLYRLLPGQVGYHFAADGKPDTWFSRESAMVVMLFPQVFLAVFSVVLTLGIVRLKVLSVNDRILGMRVKALLQLMGNIAVLPQVVLGFVMLDIFFYNAYEIHIMPPSAFFAILGGVTVAMVVALFLFVSRARKRPVYQPEESR